MNTVAIYIRYGESADLLSVEVHTTFGHVRPRGLALLGGSLSRLLATWIESFGVPHRDHSDVTLLACHTTLVLLTYQELIMHPRDI